MSIIATAVKHLLAAGVTGDALVQAIADMEANAPAPIVAEAAPTKGTLRMRAYRSRGGDQIPPALRQEVFERDGYACCDCGALDRLECDHVIPLMAGGPTTLENLQTLCRSCNARKRDRIRKSDKRGQSATISDISGFPMENGGVSSPSPLPLLSPQTPQITPTPLPHPEGKPARTRATWACPEGINPDHWRDVLANRKAKRMALTPTAYEYQLREIGKLSDDEWPPGRLVEHAAQMGWAGIHDPRDAKNRPHAQRPHTHRRNGNGFLDAIIDDERADRANARV